VLATIERFRENLRVHLGFEFGIFEVCFMSWSSKSKVRTNKPWRTKHPVFWSAMNLGCVRIAVFAHVLFSFWFFSCFLSRGILGITLKVLSRLKWNPASSLYYQIICIFFLYILRSYVVREMIVCYYSIWLKQKKTKKEWNDCVICNNISNYWC